MRHEHNFRHPGARGARPRPSTSGRRTLLARFFPTLTRKTSRGVTTAPARRLGGGVRRAGPEGRKSWRWRSDGSGCRGAAGCGAGVSDFDHTRLQGWVSRCEVRARPSPRLSALSLAGEAGPEGGSGREAPDGADGWGSGAAVSAGTRPPRAGNSGLQAVSDGRRGQRGGPGAQFLLGLGLRRPRRQCQVRRVPLEGDGGGSAAGPLPGSAQLCGAATSAPFSRWLCWCRRGCESPSPPPRAGPCPSRGLSSCASARGRRPAAVRDAWEAAWGWKSFGAGAGQAPDGAPPGMSLATAARPWRPHLKAAGTRQPCASTAHAAPGPGRRAVGVRSLGGGFGCHLPESPPGREARAPPGGARRWGGRPRNEPLRWTGSRFRGHRQRRTDARSVEAAAARPAARAGGPGRLSRGQAGSLDRWAVERQSALPAERMACAGPGSAAPRTCREAGAAFHSLETYGEAGCGRGACPGARLPRRRAWTPASHSGEAATDFKEVPGIRFEFQ